MDKNVFYECHRDRTRPVLKDKHIKMFDQEFEKISNSTRAMSVLEIGCGTGIFLRYLEHKGYGRIVGIDADQGLSESLSDLKSARVYLGDLFDIRAQHFPTEHFDRIVLYDVIEHIEFKALVGLLTELKGLLTPPSEGKDGGKIIIRAPNMTSPWGVKLFFDTFDHVTPASPGRMAELAAFTGYVVEGVYPQMPGGSWARRMADNLLHAVLSRVLVYRPDIWTANFLAVLSVRNKPEPAL